MSPRVTMRDIARKTGYSMSAVSMALRDHPGLPQATCETVRHVAREMGYRPDPILAAAAAQRWRGHPGTRLSTLALLRDLCPGSVLEGEAGLRERAERLGYRLESFDIHAPDSGPRLSRILYARGIRGLLVGQVFGPTFCPSFDWTRFAAVGLSEGAFRPPVHLVMPDHFRAVQGCWDYAAQHGARRIGTILLDIPQALDFHDRRAAYVDRQSDLPASRRMPLLTVASVRAGAAPQWAANVATVRAWLARHRPDAVLAYGEFVWWLLRDAGWERLDRPAAFVVLWKTAPQPQWPGFLLSTDEIGRRAVDWLDSLLRAGECGLPAYPATMQIEMRWEAREPGAGSPGMPGRPLN